MRMLLAAALLVLGTSARAAVSYPIEIDSAVQLSASPTVASSSVYSVADALGDKFTLAGATRRAGGKGMLRHMRAFATVSTTVGFDVMVFSRSFSGTAKNEPWVPLAGDVNNSFVGVVSIAAADWTALGSGAAYAENTDIDLPYNLPAGESALYGQMVIRKGDDSFAADSLVLKFDAVWQKR